MLNNQEKAGNEAGRAGRGVGRGWGGILMMIWKCDYGCCDYESYLILIIIMFLEEGELARGMEERVSRLQGMLFDEKTELLEKVRRNNQEILQNSKEVFMQRNTRSTRAC